MTIREFCEDCEFTNNRKRECLFDLEPIQYNDGTPVACDSYTLNWDIKDTYKVCIKCRNKINNKDNRCKRCASIKIFEKERVIPEEVKIMLMEPI